MTACDGTSRIGSLDGRAETQGERRDERRSRTDSQGREIMPQIGRAAGTATAPLTNRRKSEPPKATPQWEEALREHMRLPSESELPSLEIATQRYGEEIEKAHADYSLRGFSMIPLRLGTKAAHDNFNRFCKSRPTNADLREWQLKSMFGGLGFACGPAASPDRKYEFVALDIDSREIAERWLAQASDLSDCMTNRTKKGIHVCFLANRNCIPPSGEGQNIILLYDEERRPCGELRLRRAYIAAPPTLHPDSVPGNHFIYREDDGKGRFGGLMAAELRRVDDVRAFIGLDLIRASAVKATNPTVKAWLLGEETKAETGDDQEFARFMDGIIERRTNEPPQVEPRHTPPSGAKIDLDGLLKLAGMSAFNPEHRAFAASWSLPQAIGEREKHCLVYGQHLLVMPDFPAFRRAFANDPDLQTQVIREYQSLIAPELRKEIGVVGRDMRRAIPRVHTPAGTTSLDHFIAEAKVRPEPVCLAPLVERHDLDAKDIHLLRIMHVGIDWHLRQTGQRFYISNQQVGNLFGVSRTEGWNILNSLLSLKIIKRLSVGNGLTKKSSEYRLTCRCFDKQFLEEGG